MGGYSSTLFHLLYRFSPELRADFERSDEHRWIQRYGFEEVTVGKDDDAVEDGRNSRRRKFRKVVRERPGLVLSALFHIIGNTVFLRLADVAAGLPDYTEQVMLSGMDSQEDSTGYSQRSAYTTVFEELETEAGGRPIEGFQAAPVHLPPDPAGLPRRMHQGRDGLRSGERGSHRPSATPLGRKTLPQGEVPRRPGGQGEDGGPKGAGLRHPHGHQGHHRQDGRHPHPARVPGGGDEGRRRGPGQEGGVGRRQRPATCPPTMGGCAAGPSPTRSGRSSTRWS